MALGKMIIRKQIPKSYHSMAGRSFLKKEKAKKTPVYFRNIKRTSNIERLKQAGLSESDIRSLTLKRKR